MVKTRTTIVIDEGLWAKFRIHAIKQGKTASLLLEELMKREMSITQGNKDRK